MIISEFKTLRQSIIKSCSTIDAESIDISSRYKFKIDFRKLDNLFKQKNLDLNVLAFDFEQESYEPGLNEIQMVSEYTKSDEDFDRIFNGKTTICNFMLYRLSDEYGNTLDIHNNSDDPITRKELFDLCNNNGRLDTDFIKELVKSVPVYRVVVEKSFNIHTDQFKYRVYLRQNDPMIKYHLNKNKTEDDTVEEEE